MYRLKKTMIHVCVARKNIKKVQYHVLVYWDCLCSIAQFWSWCMPLHIILPSMSIMVAW